MVTVTAFVIPKLTTMRASDKTRLQTATNLEDTSKGLVVPSHSGERIRPSHGGLVQYHIPEDAGRKRSISSASSPSNLSSNISTRTCPYSQRRRRQRQVREAGNTSTSNSSFSWKSFWHPNRKDEDHASWCDGWLASERIPEWQAHTSLSDKEVALSASPISDSSMSFGLASTPASSEPEEQHFSHATSTRGIEPSSFVGCQQVMPESSGRILSVDELRSLFWNGRATTV